MRAIGGLEIHIVHPLISVCFVRVRCFKREFLPNFNLIVQKVQYNGQVSEATPWQKIK